MKEDLRALPYPAYLRTDHWKGLRARKFSEVGRRCQICNGQESIEVHHRTYERLGEERMEDLTVLCHPCHKRHHRAIGRGQKGGRRGSLLSKGVEFGK